MSNRRSLSERIHMIAMGQDPDAPMGLDEQVSRLNGTWEEPVIGGGTPPFEGMDDLTIHLKPVTAENAAGLGATAATQTVVPEGDIL